MVERADRALYWAKACGRDAVLRWTPETADRIERARAVAGAREAGPAGAACAVAALAAIADELDPGHARRVADLAVALAAGADWPPTRQARLHQAALLHDLGAIARPSDHARIGAELAAAVLDAEQRDWIRRHREPGAGVLDGAALLGIADDHLSGRELDPAAAGRVGEALAWWA
jgi:response regulator RpfG family c-di-GMP phosphodiesterase